MLYLFENPKQKPTFGVEMSHMVAHNILVFDIARAALDFMAALISTICLVSHIKKRLNITDFSTIQLTHFL